MIIYFFIVSVVAYLVLTLWATYLVHQLPRRPVNDLPDWGKLIDTFIPTIEGGTLEVWRVEPEGPSRGIVLLAHGWSRNRDRMVGRARVFGRMGFTTVVHSARDHGQSSPRRFMNALRFAEDIESVMKWINEPVILYGHSAGAAGAVIAAHRNPSLVRLLFLEGCYARTKRALLSLYINYNWFFGVFFGPMVVFWMDLFYRKGLDSVSPARLAPDLNMPVLLIHGERDKSFPLSYMVDLRESFPPGRVESFVAHGADHSGSSLTPEYPGVIKSFVENHLD
jgi:pimeloyl-ACP methyl ester carboxylesterase